MNPNDTPLPTQTGHSLRILPSLQPKRRCKAFASSPEDRDDSSVIVPFYSAIPKPVRFTRSGHAFQIWKEPKSHRHEAAPRKPDFGAAVSEALQSYAKSMALLLSWRLPHSP